MKFILATVALLLTAAPSYAATCAHVEAGQALDPQPCSSTADYLKRFTPEVTGSWVVAIVPDGTRHNARDNGNGTYTNPTAAAVAPKSSVITVTDFKKRLTLAEKVAIAGSADVTVKVFWDELNTAQTVDLTDNDTVGGVDYLVSIGVLTMQRAAVVLTP